MGKFFQPWRRKIGVLTLLVACLFATGWVRSGLVNNVIVVSLAKKWIFNFVSSRCGLGARAAAYNPDSQFMITWDSRPNSPTDELDPMSSVSVPIRLDWGEFHFGCKGLDLFQKSYFAICFIPYWSVVAPLTMISCWLLLSKPRPSKSESSVERIPETAG